MSERPDEPLDLEKIADLLEARIAPALERIALALERGGFGATVPDARSEAIAELRRAIREGAFPLAATLLGDFRIDFPDAPEADSLADELAEAGRTAAVDRRARLDAARVAQDAEGVLDYRDELAPLLSPTEREAVDRDVLNWLMALLMKRMRTGTVRADVAVLAGRMADVFGHRPEGASLRASLPTLRRSAGLCPKCANPYTGVEDACPECLAGIPRIADLPETPAPPT